MSTGMFVAGAGIVLSTRLADLPGTPVLVLLAVTGALLLAVRLRALRLAGCLLLGLAWGCWRGQAVLDSLLPAALEGRELPLRLCVQGLPERRSDARGESWRLGARVLPGPDWGGGDIDLGWYGHAELAPGQLWELRATLRRPRGFVNPGGRDHAAWMLAGGLAASGYVRGKGPPPRRVGSCAAPVDALRVRLRDALLARFGTEPQVGALLANAIGDGSRLRAEQWEIYAATGTTHLMVISGLHITLVALLVQRCAQWLARRAPVLPGLLPARQWGLLAALPAAVAYGALAGLEVPTQRALLMLAVATLHLLAERPASVWSALGSAWLAVLAWQPLAATQAGFWLSFLAVGALLLGCGGRLAPFPWLAQATRPQLVVCVALLGPLLALGQAPAPLAPLVNALAVPVVNLLVVPGALLGCALLGLAEWPAHALLLGVLRVLDLLELGLRQAAAVRLELPALAPGGLATLALAMLGSLWLLGPRGLPARWLGLLLLLPLLQREPAERLLDFTVLDVGQGTAVLLRTRHHALLYDTGPRFSERFDAGSQIVLPALRRAGIGALDLMVLSHSDNDHAGGAPALLRRLPVARVLGGEPVAGIALAPCRRGSEWRWDGVRFRVLHPAAGGAHGDNDRSCVLRIDAGGSSLLLAGDIEEAAERELLAALPQALRADLLLVPHHGSRTSSSARFVAAVQPRIAIVSSGYRNRFGHPHPTVVARYAAAGAALLDTASDGAIAGGISAAGEWEALRCERVAARRYWFSAAASSTACVTTQSSEPRASRARTAVPGATAAASRSN